MWKKDGASPKEVETVIGPSVHIEGNFLSDGSVILAGTLTGTIQTKGDLRIEETARVTANIVADSVMIAGVVKGDVAANGQLDIAASARIQGNIEARMLSIAPGAVVNGKCVMRSGDGKDAKEPRESRAMKEAGGEVK